MARARRARRSRKAWFSMVGTVRGHARCRRSGSTPLVKERTMSPSTRPLAVVTGASSGIGRELAILCAKQGYDLVVAADEPEIRTAADELRGLGANAEPVQVDLATGDGVNALLDECEGREVELLLANAGHGLGGAFL